MRRQLDRRDFMKFAGAGAAGLSLGCMTQSSVLGAGMYDKRPNILWIMGEDICPDIGCYGTPAVKTPNLDRLASEGIRYTNAFVTGPVCSASRSAMITGMYQTSIGAHNHRSHRGDGYTLPEPVKLITDYLRRAGYYTTNNGKTDFNFKPKGKAFDGKDWKGRKEGQPFFAQVTFGVTHRAFKRDKNNPIDPDKVKVPPYYPDTKLTRRDWADYLESMQILDGQVGQLLKRLEDEGLADNTVVIFIGDHGSCHVWGKQWLYEGGIHIPLIIRWPGVLKAGQVREDMVSAIDISATILKVAGIEPPAHMEGEVFLGPDAKKRDYIISARDRCDETVDRIRCVRTKRYKYIRNFMPERPYTQFNAYKTRQYPVVTLLEVLHKRGELTEAQAKFMAPRRPKEELYDLVNDPYELCNLADDARYETKLVELRAILEKWIIETGDKGQIAEDKKSVDQWQREAKQRYKRDMKQKGLPADCTPEEHLKWWEKKLLGSEIVDSESR